MRNLPWYAAGAAIVAAFVTHLLVPVVTGLAIRLRAMDQPGVRKLHDSAVPRLGGVAIMGGLGIAAGFAALGHWTTWAARIGGKELLALVAGTLLVFLVGVVDDLRGVGSGTKFLVELAAAGLLVGAGWSFGVLRLPFVGGIDLGLFGPIVSLLWIVGVTNAINLIDGLDGLAGGVVAIISVSMLAYAALQGSPGSVVLMAATAGACLGFLRHNWEPARIFMGDSGALTLGFLLAAMSVHSALKAPAAVAIVVPILALGVPVMDTLLVMAVRFLDRPQGRPLRRFLRMFRRPPRARRGADLRGGARLLPHGPGRGRDRPDQPRPAAGGDRVPGHLRHAPAGPPAPGDTARPPHRRAAAALRGAGVPGTAAARRRTVPALAALAALRQAARGEGPLSRRPSRRQGRGGRRMMTRICATRP